MTAKYRLLYEKHLDGFEVFSGGKQAQAWCKFHDDRGTKKGMNINLETGLFFCYSCGAKGNAAQFAQKMGVEDFTLQVDYNQLTTLADELREEVGNIDINEMNYPESFKFITGVENSLIGKKALEYITEKRGLSIESVLRLKIGYCFKGPYSGRIIIPTLDEKGRVEYFVGRSFLFNDVPYKNPRNDEAGKGKTQVLFNYHEAKTKRQIIICEGVFDAIATGMSAVAVFGKTLSSAQCQLLRQTQTEEFIVLLDGEAQEEAQALAQILAGYGRTVRVAQLPQDEDPDSIDRLALTSYIKNAKPVTLSNTIEAIVNGI